MTPPYDRVLAAAGTLLLAGATAAMLPSGVARWGLHGHEISGRAAATDLPEQLPAFFRSATEQLAWLNPEPDRWRGDGFRELNEAKRYDHYVDFEYVPDSIRDAVDRFRYLRALQGAGLTHPARDAGLLPFRIVELYQSLVVAWRLWRAEQDPVRRAWIEQRIINDAGILGHYVTDGANPHHTTVHHDGWRADFPNPRNFTTERGFHSRFESQFVEANVTRRTCCPTCGRRAGSKTCGRRSWRTCCARTAASSGSTSWTRSKRGAAIRVAPLTATSPSSGWPRGQHAARPVVDARGWPADPPARAAGSVRAGQ
jgi:hypothetical protein